MKTRNDIGWILLLPLLFAQCGGSEEEGDAWGSFETTEVLVSPEAGGLLQQLNLREGDHLKAGEQVGFVDTSMLSLQREELRATKNSVRSRQLSIDAQIDIFEQQLANLETDLSRLQNLLKDKAATQKQVDDALGQKKVLQKQIRAQEVQKETVRAELSVLNRKAQTLEEQLRKCHIVNPVSGTVLGKYAEAGEMVAPGKPLYKIGRMDEMILKVYVSATQLPGLQIGQGCEVRIDNSREGYKSYKGQLQWISEEAEFTPKILQTKEERVNLVYAVKIAVPNDGGIKTGMPGLALFAQ